MTKRMGDSPRFSGAVLAGGASRRMGRDKASIEVGGVTMLTRVTGALQQAGAESVLIVGGAEVRAEAVAGLDRTTRLDDRWPGEGPLGGLITALEAADTDIVIVVACDLVWLDAASIRAVVTSLSGDPAQADMRGTPTPGARGERVIPEVGNDVLAAVAFTDRREPLCAAWRRQDAASALLAAFLDGERSIARVLDRMRVIQVGVHPRALTNVNTPEELVEAARSAPGAAPIDRWLTT